MATLQTTGSIQHCNYYYYYYYHYYYYYYNPITLELLHY